MNKWHRRFLRLCREISTYSKDPSTQVSAIAVSPDRSDLCIGYNGLPRKLLDKQEILNNRSEKYKVIIHAEINLILNAKRDLSGYTLYTFPFMPCSICSSIIIQAGFDKIVSLKNDNSRWIDSFNISMANFKDAGIPLILYEMEQLDE